MLLESSWIFLSFHQLIYQIIDEVWWDVSVKVRHTQLVHPAYLFHEKSCSLWYNRGFQLVRLLIAAKQENYWIHYSFDFLLILGLVVVLVTVGPFRHKSLFREDNQGSNRTGYMWSIKNTHGPRAANQLVLSPCVVWGWVTAPHLLRSTKRGAKYGSVPFTAWSLPVTMAYQMAHSRSTGLPSPSWFVLVCRVEGAGFE